MSGHQEGRMVALVENAHPRRILRHADEWMRCAAILEDAANRIDSIAARQSEIGGQTGPTMAVAMARASDVLRVKARDLRRGSDALAQVADATLVSQERKRKLDRDHPGDGNHVVWREEGARLTADSQEDALRHGIAVMRSIRRGEDPRVPIDTSAPGPVVVRPPEWWPSTPPPQPPIDLADPDDDDDDAIGVPQGPGPVSSGAGGSTAPVGVPSAGSPGGPSFGSGSLAGAAV
ncbi:MAG: hypothetical protein Q7T52_01440, partial [Nocardioides sp.]